MSRLIVVSNRCVQQDDGYIDPFITSLGKIFSKHPGLWFGWNGSVTAGKRSRTCSVTHHAHYATHGWDLSPNEYDNAYQGYVHNVLWPIFHNRPDLAAYKKAYFITWKSYNTDVARTVGAQLRPDDRVWVHDYHLLAVGKQLREDGHRNRCGFFLHQPFPPGEVIRAVPEHDTLMRALLQYDVIGFQSSADINNFLSCVLRFYRAERIAGDTIQVNGRSIQIGIFPCGIDTSVVGPSQATPQAVEEYQRQIIISNDVINDVSGIHYRLEAMRALINTWPHYVRGVSLLQICDPAREYPWSSPDLCTRLERYCGEINGQYGDFTWYPVNYIHNALCKPELLPALYARADVALFTPLSEGMSLSAKAFILAQDPEDPGVLILSACSGAAEQLTEALIVNPYDARSTGEALHSALAMPLHERRRRHSRLLAKVQRYDCHWWAAAFLTALSSTAPPPRWQAAFRTSHHGVFTPQKLY